MDSIYVSFLPCISGFGTFLSQKTMQHTGGINARITWFEGENFSCLFTTAAYKTNLIELKTGGKKKKEGPIAMSHRSLSIHRVLLYFCEWQIPKDDDMRRVCIPMDIRILILNESLLWVVFCIAVAVNHTYFVFGLLCRIGLSWWAFRYFLSWNVVDYLCAGCVCSERKRRKRNKREKLKCGSPGFSLFSSFLLSKNSK